MKNEAQSNVPCRIEHPEPEHICNFRRAYILDYKVVDSYKSALGVEDSSIETEMGGHISRHSMSHHASDS